LVIGGLGGSGTRLVAEIARRLRIFIGVHLNNANDNLWFTLLLKRPSVREPAHKNDAHAALDLLTKAMTSGVRLTRPERQLIRAAVSETPRPHDQKRLRHWARTLKRRPNPDSERHVGWGWKEPNSHVFLDHLDDHFPRLRYIHVLRNGLDMAISKNQRQIGNWHRYFGVPAPPPGGPSPAAALHFWCVANQRAISFAGSLGSRFLCVNYDELCLDPARELPPLLSFIAGDMGAGQMHQLAGLMKPRSIGRHKELDLSCFDPADLAVVEDLGFPITPSRRDG
jgi:hypothetical protein